MQEQETAHGGRRELAEIERGFARETYGWPWAAKVRWLLWKTTLGCGTRGKDEWSREGPACLEPLVGYVKSEKGKKIFWPPPLSGMVHGNRAP